MKQGENKSIVALLGIIAFLILGVVYYYVIMPKNETQIRTTNSINQLKAENSELQNKVALLSAVDTDDEEDEYELRKKLPVNRELDKLLHKIHEVELMSDSKIISIAFNNYDSEVSQAVFGAKTDEEEAEDEEAAESTETEESETDEDAEADEEQSELADEVDETKPVTPIDIELLPDELKLISLNLVLSVLDYDHLLTFLEEIEEMERVVRIDSVDFSKAGEEEFAQENPDERVTVSVQLTTFYSEEVGN